MKKNFRDKVVYIHADLKPLKTFWGRRPFRFMDFGLGRVLDFVPRICVSSIKNSFKK